MASDRITVTLEDLVQEIERRERSDPLAEVYKPTVNQKRIHCSRKQITIVQGANRAGKSTGLVADDLFYALHRPVYAEVPTGPLVLWYVVPSLGMFQRIIYPILSKLLPFNAIKSFPMHPHPLLTLTNGSKIFYLSSDMKGMRLQGASVHKVTMDETPKKDAYNELQARVMDTRGRIVLGFLPEQESDWVDNEIIIPHRAGLREDVDFIEMPLADEATDKSLVPWFTDDDIKAFKLKWPDPDVQAARIYGRRVRTAGLVLKQYHPSIHHVKEFVVPRHWSRFLLCDPQYYRFGVLWFAVDEHGTYYITDEYFSQEESLHVRAEKMAAITLARATVDHELELPVYVDDANPTDTKELNWHFARIQAQSGRSSCPLAAIPLPFRKRVNVRFDDSMVLRLHSLMEPLESRPYPPQTCEDPHDPEYGAPRVLFFETLFSKWFLNRAVQRGSRLFWEISKLQWGKSGKPDKTTADGGELVDCLMYGCNVQAATDEPPPEVHRVESLADQLLWKRIRAWDRLTYHA